MSEVQKQKRRFQFVNKFKIKFVIIFNIIMHLALLVASGVITILNNTSSTDRFCKINVSHLFVLHRA